MNNNIKQIIVVRKDLNMRKGKLAAQVAHASLQVFLNRGEVPLNKECGNDLLIRDLTKPMVTWLSSGTAKIVVGCDTEDELLNIHKQALDANIPCSLIRDAGKTEFKEPTYTCVALGPEYSEYIDKITGNLKLL